MPARRLIDVRNDMYQTVMRQPQCVFFFVCDVERICQSFTCWASTLFPLYRETLDQQVKRIEREQMIIKY